MLLRHSPWSLLDRPLHCAFDWSWAVRLQLAARAR
jgi:hypothetical protein